MMDRSSLYSSRMAIHDSISRDLGRSPQKPEDPDTVGMTAAHFKFFKERSDKFYNCYEILFMISTIKHVVFISVIIRVSVGNPTSRGPFPGGASPEV